MRLAPYAKAHAAAARAGFAPAKAIFVYDGWRLRWLIADHPELWHVLVPEGEDPAGYDWSWVAGFPMLVLSAKPARAIALGEALAGAKPQTLDLLVAGASGPILMRWRLTM